MQPQDDHGHDHAPPACRDQPDRAARLLRDHGDRGARAARREAADRCGRDPPPDRGAGFAHAGARRQGRGPRLGRSRLQGAPAGQRPRGLRGAGDHLLRRHRADRPGEHRPGPQPDRLHALLLLPAAGAGPAAGLVQAEALPGPCGDRAAGRAGRVRHRHPGRRRDPRQRFDRHGALPRAAASGRQARRTTARSSWPAWSRATP